MAEINVCPTYYSLPPGKASVCDALDSSTHQHLVQQTVHPGRGASTCHALLQQQSCACRQAPSGAAAHMHQVHVAVSDTSSVVPRACAAVRRKALTMRGWRVAGVWCLTALGRYVTERGPAFGWNNGWAVCMVHCPPASLDRPDCPGRQRSSPLGARRCASDSQPTHSCHV
jgi:hypothetical protein